MIDENSMNNNACPSPEDIPKDRKNFASSVADANPKVPDDPAMDPNSDSDESSSESESAYQYMDLADILRYEIENAEYTCLICTGEVGITSKIWSCKVCYRVYDLECILGWSKRGLSQSHEWKCPSCNSAYPEYDPHTKKKNVLQYTCWCGKVPEPFYNGHIPHSCGQTCNSKLPKCVHGCPSVCHPGPHSECTAIGPSMLCLCGKNRRQWPCVITPYDGWQCKEVCNEYLPCGLHKCPARCHSGLCGKCTTKVLSPCYCGKSKEMVLCSERHPEVCEKTSHGKSEDGGESMWVGYYSCGKPCGEPLDCGNHACERACHVSTSKDSSAHRCPLIPKVDEKCLCGKTLVREILGRERENCKEPLPCCDKKCGKLLPCGEHSCPYPCHDGPCNPCRLYQTVKCRCGFQTFDVPCRAILDGVSATCSHKCSSLLDCGRHRCGDVCCPFERSSLQKSKLKKKAMKNLRISSDMDLHQLSSLSLSSADSSLEPAFDSLDNPHVHICTRTCDRKLSCGIHQCVDKCHSGPCTVCLEASYDDYVCPCGHTVVKAPIRCGSMIPKCHFPCPVQRTCGHESGHDCHDSSDPSSSCPPCTARVERLCDCGRTTVKGVLCSQQRVSCGRLCGKTLKCGHLCPRVCHAGDCQGPSSERCVQKCLKPLPCGHPHGNLCHYPQPCNPAECRAVVIDTCSCGNLHRKRECYHRQLQQAEDQAAGNATNGKLPCDDSCALKIRNQLLAKALGVPVAESEDRNKYEFNDDLLDLYFMDPVWGDKYEQELINFIEQDKINQFMFPAMNSQRRMFLHLYAQECELASHSVDSEPKRSVVVMKTIKCRVPPARLKDFAKV